MSAAPACRPRAAELHSGAAEIALRECPLERRCNLDWSTGPPIKLAYLLSDTLAGRHRVVAAGGEEISTVPTIAVPADAMVRVDPAGTPTITIPVITSLAHSIASCLGIAGQDGPGRQDRRDGGEQSEPAHGIPPRSECYGTMIPQMPLVILARDQLDLAAPSAKSRCRRRSPNEGECARSIGPVHR